MSVKAKILAILEKNKGRVLSGQKIAGDFGVTRAAVSKAVRDLRRDGHSISASSGSGYVMADDSDVLSVEGLAPYLSVGTDTIHIYKSLESTNKTAKELALNNCGHGTVVIADSQTAGRGRFGRSFYSPSGSGLYISFVLKPDVLKLPDLTMITAAAATAVCRAVKEVTGRETQIKWVNDVLLDGKKICGILTEAVTDFESGGIDWIVTGIGINVSTPHFPDGLDTLAASIFPHGRGMRNRLAAELINLFASAPDWMSAPETYEEYKRRSVVLGRDITVTRGNEIFEATALELDNACRLIIKRTDGSIETLSSGEVSVKL